MWKVAIVVASFNLNYRAYSVDSAIIVDRSACYDYICCLSTYQSIVTRRPFYHPQWQEPQISPAILSPSLTSAPDLPGILKYLNTDVYHQQTRRLLSEFVNG